MSNKAYLIDKYTGEAEIIPHEEVVLAAKGLKKVETDAATTYMGEEYLIVIPKN